MIIVGASNSIYSHTITKLDILTGLDPLQVCVAYERDGQTYRDLPMGMDGLEGYTPVFEAMLGWTEDIRAARKWEDLPVQAQAYIQRIEGACDVPVGWISVGPERDQLVVR